jgi:hypothetical protein
MPVLTVPDEAPLVPIAHLGWHQHLDWAADDLLGALAEER